MVIRTRWGITRPMKPITPDTDGKFRQFPAI